MSGKAGTAAFIMLAIIIMYALYSEITAEEVAEGEETATTVTGEANMQNLHHISTDKTPTGDAAGVPQCILDCEQLRQGGSHPTCVEQKRLSAAALLTKCVADCPAEVLAALAQAANTSCSRKSVGSRDIPHLDPHNRSWIVVVTVNSGFFDFFLNWCYYFLRLHLGLPVIVMAEDDAVFEKVRSLSRLKQLGFSVQRTALNMTEDLEFGAADYKKMVSRRGEYLLGLLQQGKNVIYSDIDTVWRKDPLPFFTGDRDAWIAKDGEEHAGDKPYYCTGFMAIVSNERTIHMMRDWDAAMRKNPQTNQPIFNKILFHGGAGVRHAALPVDDFPNGWQYFTAFPPRKQANVTLVHNNWIQGGKAKRARFKRYRLWHSSDAHEPRT